MTAVPPPNDVKLAWGRELGARLHPSPRPRCTRYRFVGETHFIATDPARCRQAAEWSAA
jgi:hypothetical protein